MVDRSTVETLAQALAQFETIGMPARSLAVRTRCQYARDLRELLGYLADRGTTQLEEVRSRELEAYLAELDRRGLQGSTRNRKTHTLKTFFKWLVSHELLATDPAARAIKKEPRYLAEEEYRQLLRACSHHARDAVIIEVFLQTGMRLSELARLTLADVVSPSALRATLTQWAACRCSGKAERSIASR
ncbi:MAG TPA: site-specific integrase [Herpetosiphonaceae bacterium]|nr:site-specific integrase [Herpetosiphonaceae bacterium]